jgi:hypothetical protein
VISLDDVRVGARFLSRLPGFLRRPLALADARETFRRRLEGRAEAFLTLAKRAIYERPSSPYHALLKYAGCERGDLVKAGVRSAAAWRR